MIVMDGEPGPTLIEPRLESVAMRPMLADTVGKAEAVLGRNEAAHQRPARRDGSHGREKGDLLDDRLRPC